MKKGLIMISGVFLSLLFSEKSFAQQVTDKKSVSANAVAIPATDDIASDTAEVQINTSKKLNDNSSTPVPVEQKPDNKEETIIINQSRKLDDPH